jgi:tRNA threonylcarbamoyladenosine modification (KEOPS) complex  Pcc1 subunit
MKAKAVLRLKFPSKGNLEIVYRALMPEVEKPATTRSKASLKIEGDFLVLSVEAKDTVALRAALNAYLRWISTCTTLLRTLENLVCAT